MFISSQCTLAAKKLRGDLRWPPTSKTGADDSISEGDGNVMYCYIQAYYRPNGGGRPIDDVYLSQAKGNTCIFAGIRRSRNCSWVESVLWWKWYGLSGAIRPKYIGITLACPAWK